jgi:hypothetical protein
VAIDLVVEEMLGQVEGQREHAHQVGRETLHRAEILGPGLAQLGGTLRPQVGREVRAGFGAGEIGFPARHVDRADRQ